jgi:hypothetical protein
MALHSYHAGAAYDRDKRIEGKKLYSRTHSKFKLAQHAWFEPLELAAKYAEENNQPDYPSEDRRKSKSEYAGKYHLGKMVGRILIKVF